MNKMAEVDTANLPAITKTAMEYSGNYLTINIKR
jgi:hypothetical protein